MGYLTIADAMPVRRPKQSDRPAATLYSPPETWISTERALRKGITPGSSRVTSAPRARKSRAHESWRMFKLLIASPMTQIDRVMGRSSLRGLPDEAFGGPTDEFAVGPMPL